MNLDQLKKSVGFRVQLEPAAIRLDALGRELPSRNEDWIIQGVTDTEIRLDEANMMGLTTTLGTDSVHHFSRDPSRSIGGGPKYGFLTLCMQMFIQNARITYRPCARPGERVAPLPTPVAEMWVDFNYPVASRIQEKLKTAGYRTAWCRQSRLAQIELEGWEVVIENDRHGMPTSFHLRDNPENQIYVKTREPDLHALANHPFFRGQPGLLSCTVSNEPRAVVFRFADPTSVAGFQIRMNGRTPGLRYERVPGRLDTLLGYFTVGSR